MPKQVNQPTGCFKFFKYILLGSLIIAGLIIIVPIIVLVITSEHSSDSSSSVGTVQQVIDTTSPSYIIDKLSAKPKLTKKEKRQLKEAQQQNLRAYKASLKAQKLYAFENDCLTGNGEACIPVIVATKQMLHNPKSFEHVMTEHVYDDDRDLIYVRMTYRATNGFGALTLHKAYAVMGDNCEVQSIQEVNL